MLPALFQNAFVIVDRSVGRAAWGWGRGGAPHFGIPAYHIKMSVAKPEMIENGRASFVLIVAALLLAPSLVSKLYHWFIQIPPILYDKFITDMTEVWYDAVFSKVSDGERLLDVGIGTAGWFRFFSLIDVLVEDY